MNKFINLQTFRRLSNVNTIKKTIKNESFVYKSFFGELDKDYLKYPDFSDVKPENVKYETIKKNFKIYSSDNEKFKQNEIFNTESFTTFELIRFFEAIGCSLNYKSEFYAQSSSGSNSLIEINDKLTITKRFLQEYNEKKSFTQTILPMLIHNALILPSINSSSKIESEKKILSSKTAFAFCELNEKFTSLPYTFWNSTATYDEKAKHWILNGNKNRILKDEYDQYLVFCRVKASNTTEDAIAAFLLSNEEVSIQNDGSDNYGNQYLRIEFKNILVERPATISSDNEISALNVKAKGQLAVAGLIYGIIRQIFCNAISQNQRNIKDTGSDTNQLVVHKLAHMSQMLYSLESVLYHTTAHFDLYDNEKLDLYSQAIICKILATEYSTTMLNELRLLFNSNELSNIFSSETSNVLSVLDSFLESSTSNRLLLAANGLRTVGAWKYDHLIKLKLGLIYLRHFIKYEILGQRKLEQRFENSYDDLKSFKSTLHPSLYEAASQFETVLNELKLLSDKLLVRYGKEVVQNQIEMSRLASVAMSAYQMLAVIGRTNNALNCKLDSTSGQSIDRHQSADDGKKSVDSTLKNNSFISGQMSKNECLKFCNRICSEHTIIVQENRKLIIGILDTSDEYRSRIIHKRNLRTGGYFPASTFDRVI